MAIRSAKRQDDVHFVWNSYLLSNPVRAYLKHNSRILLPHYFTEYHKEITEYLREKAVLRMHVSDTDSNTIHGWAAGHREGDETVIKYVYVKSAHRRHGIATQLILSVAKECGSGKLRLASKPPKKQAEFWNLLGVKTDG